MDDGCNVQYDSESVADTGNEPDHCDGGLLLVLLGIKVDNEMAEENRDSRVRTVIHRTVDLNLLSRRDRHRSDQSLESSKHEECILVVHCPDTRPFSDVLSVNANHNDTHGNWISEGAPPELRILQERRIGLERYRQAYR